MGPDVSIALVSCMSGSLAHSGIQYSFLYVFSQIVHIVCCPVVQVCNILCAGSDIVSFPCENFRYATKTAMNTLLTVLSVSGTRGQVQDGLLQTMGSMVDTGKSLAEYKASITTFQDLNNSALDLNSYDTVRRKAADAAVRRE